MNPNLGPPTGREDQVDAIAAPCSAPRLGGSEPGVPEPMATHRQDRGVAEHGPVATDGRVDEQTRESGHRPK